MAGIVGDVSEEERAPPEIDMGEVLCINNKPR